MANPNNATISFNDNGFTITPITQGDNYTISGMDITNATIRSDLRKYLIEVKPNTAYTFIMDLNYSVLGGLSAYYSLIDSNYKVTAFAGTTSNYKVIDSTNRRYFVNITTSADTKYIGFRYGNQGPQPVTYTNIMLVEGTYNADTLPTYEPYVTPQVKQLSLGDKELAKRGTYVDTFEYDIENDKVYKNKAIGKYQFTGNENFGKTGATNLNGYVFNFPSVTTNILPPANNTLKANILSNAFITKAVDTIISEATFGIGIRSDKFLYIGTPLGSFENVSALQTYLANNITFMYYTLITPVKEEITGTLKDQIKDIYNLMSYTGTTILEVDGDLPMIIKVRGLKGE